MQGDHGYGANYMNYGSKQQLEAYAAWCNSRLRKKSGTKLVHDLARDLNDGTTLASLLSVLGGEKVSNIDWSPNTIQEKRENVQKILNFLVLHNIKVSHVTANEIVDGHLKSIMKVVMALASHYKPASVKNGQNGTRVIQNGSTHSRSSSSEMEYPPSYNKTAILMNGGHHSSLKKLHSAGSSESPDTTPTSERRASTNSTPDLPTQPTSNKQPAVVMNGHCIKNNSSSNNKNGLLNATAPNYHPKQGPHTPPSRLGQVPVPRPGSTDSEHSSSSHSLTSSTSGLSVSSGGVGGGQRVGRGPSDVEVARTTRSLLRSDHDRDHLADNANDGYGHLQDDRDGCSRVPSLDGCSQVDDVAEQAWQKEKLSMRESFRRAISSTCGMPSSAEHANDTPQLDMTVVSAAISHKSVRFSDELPLVVEEDEEEEEDEEDAGVAAAVRGDEELSRKGESELIEDTKRNLLKLQDVLLSDSDSAAVAAAPSEDSVRRSALADSEVACRVRLQRQEVAELRRQVASLQAAKCALERRVSEQEGALLQGKAELLRANLQANSWAGERQQLQRQIEEKGRQLELAKSNPSSSPSPSASSSRSVDSCTKMAADLAEKEAITRALQSQVHDLNRELVALTDREDVLKNQMAVGEKKMAKLEERLNSRQNNCPRDKTSKKQAIFQRGDVEGVRSCLEALRLGMRPEDPKARHLNSLEHAVATLLEKIVQAAECNSASNTNLIANNINSSNNNTNATNYNNAATAAAASSSGVPHHQRASLNYDSTGDPRRSPITSFRGYVSSNAPQAASGGASGDVGGAQQLQQWDSSVLAPASGQNLTKALYFVNGVTTPYAVTIRKPEREVTLGDFKTAVNRAGDYRYHFKTQDAEFGSVKEEVSRDGDPVPAWEGKVVAWLDPANST